MRVISEESTQTFAQSATLEHREGYKTPSFVRHRHLSENLSGLWVASDWISMNNECSFMPRSHINKTDVNS